MKKTLLFIAFILLSSAGFGQDITGKWYGKPDLGGQSLRIIFDIEQDGETYTAKMQSPDQSGDWIPATSVTYRDSVLAIGISQIVFNYTGRWKADETISGNFVQLGRVYELNLSREPIVVNRPQEPKPPFPYEIEEITFRNEEAKIALAGTFTKPSGEGPFPAVILVTGSDPQDRDEALAGHKPFLVIADYLTRQGIAVLRYDDRGVAGSEGVFSEATSFDLAEDAAAGIAYLRCRPDIAAGKVGLIGHSEGGLIAFLVAGQQKADFIVSLAGTGITGKEIILSQTAAIALASGAPEFMVTAQHPMLEEAINIVLSTPEREEMTEKITARFKGTPMEPNTNAWIDQMDSPWMRTFLVLDPAEYLPRITCPVLALNGEKDLQVLINENLGMIRKGLEHNPQATIKEYPGLNHLFQTANKGLPAEYAGIEETFNVGVLKDMAEWIIEVTE